MPSVCNEPEQTRPVPLPKSTLQTSEAPNAHEQESSFLSPTSHPTQNQCRDSPTSSMEVLDAGSGASPLEADVTTLHRQTTKTRASSSRPGSRPTSSRGMNGGGSNGVVGASLSSSSSSRPGSSSSSSSRPGSRSKSRQGAAGGMGGGECAVMVDLSTARKTKAFDATGRARNGQRHAGLRLVRAHRRRFARPVVRRWWRRWWRRWRCWWWWLWCGGDDDGDVDGGDVQDDAAS